MRDDSTPEDPTKAPPAPLWVKIFGGIALVVVVVFVLVLLVGSGHGPGRHGAPAAPALLS